MTATLADYEWLTSDAAKTYLTRCTEHQGELVRLVATLRKELTAVRAHLVIEQAELRQRARDKFRRADQMFFTRKGLEQATDEQIAAAKAARYRGDGILLDVCCGIGGDLLALGGAGKSAVFGLDADPIVAHLARCNCSLGNHDSVQVLTKMAEDVDASEVAGWHVDPDRRSTGQRTTALEQFTPSRDTLDAWIASNYCGGIKVAPATELDPSWQVQAEREWIGSRGECRQQMIWFAGLTQHPGKRTATVIENGKRRHVIEDERTILERAQEAGRFLHEPHAAVLAARVVPSLAAEHELQTLIPSGGYLTSDLPVHDLALASFQVEDLLPFDLKKLKAYFRERNVGRLEIKKREVAEEPEKLRKQLELRGEHASTLILCRLNGRVTAIVARRMD